MNNFIFLGIILRDAASEEAVIIETPESDHEDCNQMRVIVNCLLCLGRQGLKNEGILYIV